MAQKEPLIMSEQEQSSENSIRIKRGKVDSLSVYEITDYELDILIKGSPSSLYLNFSIFLLSVAASFLISILTTTIVSERTFTVFCVATAVGGVAGIVLGVLWWNTRGEVSSLSSKIRARIPRDEVEKE
jgi:hypothetical protein